MASHTEIADLKYASGEVRRVAALHMRKLGMTYREIGQALGGVTANRAMQIVQQATRHSVAGYRYKHENAGLNKTEADVLMPLMEYLKRIVNG